MAGSQTGNIEGTFPAEVGGIGVPASRAFPVSWTSVDGELFLFGGYSSIPLPICDIPC